MCDDDSAIFSGEGFEVHLWGWARKAASLQRSSLRASSIYRTKYLLSHSLGKKAFVNALGIHSESYGLALELAKDMYTTDAQDVVNDDEDMLEMAIEHVRENPSLLRRLELDAYAISKKRDNKKDTLNHIRLELIHGFQAWRRPYAKPRFNPQRAVCFLELGLTGLLNKEDYSDDSIDNDLSERLNKDDTRIHQESYGLALELAKDMYTADAHDVVNDDEDMLEMAIEHVRENPSLLRCLEVDAYARSKKRDNKKDGLQIDGCL
ncbi:transcription elongation factor SPT6 [Tanacetum coccineum]